MSNCSGTTVVNNANEESSVVLPEEVNNKEYMEDIRITLPSKLVNSEGMLVCSKPMSSVLQYNV